MHTSLLPLCCTHQRARSEAQTHRVCLWCQDYWCHHHKGKVHSLFSEKDQCDTENRVLSSWHDKAKDFATYFALPQSSNTLETRVWQLHDRGNAWAAVRGNDVRVQHGGGQHEEETSGGFVCPEEEYDALHHHLLSKVFICCVDQRRAINY